MVGEKRPEENWGGIRPCVHFGRSVNRWWSDFGESSGAERQTEVQRVIKRFQLKRWMTCNDKNILFADDRKATPFIERSMKWRDLIARRLAHQVRAGASEFINDIGNPLPECLIHAFSCHVFIAE